MLSTQELKSRLLLYLEAEKKVLNKQSYSIGSRSLTLANLSEIRNAIKELTNEIAEQESGGGKRKAFRVVPRDF